FKWSVCVSSIGIRMEFASASRQRKISMTIGSPRMTKSFKPTQSYPSRVVFAHRRANISLIPKNRGQSVIFYRRFSTYCVYSSQYGVNGKHQGGAALYSSQYASLRPDSFDRRYRHYVAGRCSHGHCRDRVLG